VEGKGELAPGLRPGLIFFRAARKEMGATQEAVPGNRSDSHLTGNAKLPEAQRDS
jgi:hypothetical protein